MATTATRKAASNGQNVVSSGVISFPTPLGWMAAAGCGDHLVGLVIGRRSASAAEAALRRTLAISPSAGPWSEGLAERLIEFAEGQPQSFDDVLFDEDRLTVFQRRVVHECRKIGYAHTLTYGRLAARAGRPAAARAVGGVMAANRFPIIVPCHRVVASGGGLGGFSAPDGVDLKRRMLDLEQGQPIADAPSFAGVTSRQATTSRALGRRFAR